MVDQHKQSKENILKFIEKEGGLKGKKGSETILIDDYIIEDGKVKLSVNLRNEIKNTLKEYKWDILIGLYYIVAMAITFKTVSNISKSIFWVDMSYIHYNVFTNTLFIILPVIVWLLSTNTDFWMFYDRKITLLILSGVLIIPQVFIMTYQGFYKTFIPIVSRLTPRNELTVTHIVGLGRLLTVLPALIITVAIAWVVIRAIRQEYNIYALRSFKLKHYIDFEKSNPYAYDVVLGKDLITGAKIVIKEIDRWIHENIIGATGTGKTSSVMLKQLVQDLINKVKNTDAQKKAVLKLIKEGKAYLTKEIEDEDFSVNYVKPNPGYENEFFEKVLSKYKGAGMTVMAPDDSLTDNFYNLCKAKKVKCNRVDAKLKEDGTEKEGSKGFNPLYISPSIPEWAHKKEIIKRATLTADVMQIMYEMGGSSDPYFASINRIATTTLSILVMLTYPLLNEGKIPKLEHVQLLLNDFKKIPPYYQKLQEIDTNGEYQVIIDTLRNDFLNKDSNSKFEDHCRGLRNQFNNFLLDPNIHRILCSDDTIDMDKMLADGEVTVVNIELGDLGEVNSPAFGMFFTLSFLNAVLRRPGDEFSRLYHFWYIDEFPIVVNPSLERSFTLFRKFRCGMVVAIQTFAQMHKNPFLKYLKGIMLNSCAHQIVFGRTNMDDGDIFSQLSGIVNKVHKTESKSYTSMANDNPTLAMGDRYTQQQENLISSDEIRYLDFQEITYFTVKKGRALHPRFGKVYFLTDKEKAPIKRFIVDWRALMQIQRVVKEDAAADKIETSKVPDNMKNKPFASAFKQSATVSINIRTEEKKQDIINKDEEKELQLNNTIPLNDEVAVTSHTIINANYTTLASDNKKADISNNTVSESTDPTINAAQDKNIYENIEIVDSNSSLEKEGSIQNVINSTASIEQKEETSNENVDKPLITL